MKTDIFKKNYLLELNTDLQNYIKSFLSYDEIILIYLNQYISKIVKKNKRFCNNACKYYCKYDFDIYYKIIEDLSFNKEYPYFAYSNTIADGFIKYIQRCIILKYLDLIDSDGIICLCNYNKNIIEEHLKIIKITEGYSITKYKRKQINKLIDIFNEENPNIFI